MIAVVDPDQHIAALEHDGRLLAEAAERAGLAAPVPPCPPWQVRDLLRHIHYVHQWAATHIRELPDRVIAGPSEAELLGAGPPDAQLPGAYRTGHRALAKALRTADPAISCATFLPAPSPLAFWARRQAHETAIHRADAELAAGSPVTPFPPEFAADGISELLTGFAPRERPAARPQAAQTLQLHTTDTEDDWHVVIGSDGIQARHGHRQADATVSGPAHELYLLLWNRQDASAAAVTVSGSPHVLAVWRDSMQVRWA
jgi:uncharacterized protein (TIGR03083 family)